MPYIAFDLDALNAAPDVAAHAGIEDNDAVAGMAKMWAYCFRRKTDVVAAELLAGWFRGEARRVSAALVAFGFLEATDALFRVRGAERYLRIAKAQSDAGHASKGNLKRGKTSPTDSQVVPGSLPAPPPAPLRLHPENLSGSSPALTPSTEHHIKKEVVRENIAHTPSQVPAHVTQCATEQAVKRPELHLAAVPAKRDKRPSAQEQIAKRLEEQRIARLGDVIPDEHPATRLNSMLAPLLKFDLEIVADAHALYLEDEYARGLDPPCPLMMFVAQRSQWISRATRLEAAK